MPPAPAVAARNTNTAAEGESAMTDEELQKTIQDVRESIENLPESDKPLSKEEKRRRDILLVKKDILNKIKEAREKNELSDELYHSTVYGLFVSLGEKHPYLMGLVQANLRWNAF